MSPFQGLDGGDHAREFEANDRLSNELLPKHLALVAPQETLLQHHADLIAQEHSQETPQRREETLSLKTFEETEEKKEEK